MEHRPILHSSCALATSAAELRFRVPAPPPPRRAGCLVALDRPAASLAQRVVAGAGAGPRVLHPESSAGQGAAQIRLRTAEGDVHDLAVALEHIDLVVMLATEDAGAAAAAAIGEHCARHGIMTGAFVVGSGPAEQDAVTALRPHAKVLLVTRDEDDVAAVLEAFRA